ncbi:MAG: dTDP-4-amino-4,6-dideoxygalactose transaminase [Candidatus Magnetoovum sp. WYHC-5]|nr:dTDP-4-amino-4,6-dideoxygalactose transaminase [Candidatus Magnetoovum sp. WYHC-5]
MKIPFNKPFIAGKELYYIASAVMEGHLSGDGPFTRKCHSWLEENLRCKHSLLTHSCTAALEMSAMLCGIEPGDEVIMPSFTFVSTANAFVLRGAIVTFVDIRQDSLNIDELLIEGAITNKTKAIVPMHYGGIACAMDEIMDIANRYGLCVIEDAAQALLATYKGRYLGTIGHIGCLSFHETKNIISGEGGAILINDDKYIERAEIIREKGTNRSKFFRGEIDKYTWVDIGSSYLPSEIVGAFLYAQLEEAEKIIAARVNILNTYIELLRPLEKDRFIQLPIKEDEYVSNGHMFYIITRSLEERTKLVNYLKERGIQAVFHYVPLHSSPAGIKYGKVYGHMTVTNDISDRLLRLPMYYEMETEQIYKVAQEVASFYLD